MKDKRVRFLKIFVNIFLIGALIFIGLRVFFQLYDTLGEIASFFLLVWFGAAVILLNMKDKLFSFRKL